MNEKVVKSRDIYNVQLPHFIMPFRMKSFKRCEYLWTKNSTVDTSNSLSESHWNPNNFRLHLSLYTRISKRISGASSDFFSLHYVHCVAVVSPFPFSSLLMCYFTRFVNTPDSPMYEFSFKFLYCDSICCCCCYCDWICCVFITMPSYSVYTDMRVLNVVFSLSLPRSLFDRSVSCC